MEKTIGIIQMEIFFQIILEIFWIMHKLVEVEQNHTSIMKDYIEIHWKIWKIRMW